MRASASANARACVCNCAQSGIWLTGEQAESCHRRGGSHNRSFALPPSFPPLDKNTHRGTEMVSLKACPRVFCHLVHSFSIRLIYTAWSFRRPGHCRIQKAAFKCSDRDFSRVPPPLPPSSAIHFPTTHSHLSASEKKKKLKFFKFTLPQLYPTHVFFFYVLDS